MPITIDSSLDETTETRNEIAFALIKGKYKEAPFPEDKGLFIIYDTDNLYCVMEYEKLPIEKDKDYYKEVRKIFSEEITLCLYNLFVTTKRRFANFHMKHENPSGNRLYHAAIICSNDDYNMIKQTINLIISQDKYSKDYNDIIYIQLKNNYLITIPIVTFYHLTNSGIFGYRNKVPLEILKKYKNDKNNSM